MTESHSVSVNIRTACNPISLSTFKCDLCKFAWTLHDSFYRGLFKVGQKKFCQACTSSHIELEQAQVNEVNVLDVTNWVRLDVWFEDFKCLYQCKNNPANHHRMSKSLCGHLAIYRYVHKPSVHLCATCFLHLVTADQDKTIIKSIVENGSIYTN